MLSMECLGWQPFVNSSNFKRIVIVAKNNGKAVSDMLGIENDYTKFCIDEAAYYLYNQLTKPQGTTPGKNKKETSGNKFMQTLAIWKRK